MAQPDVPEIFFLSATPLRDVRKHGGQPTPAAPPVVQCRSAGSRAVIGEMRTSCRHAAIARIALSYRLRMATTVRVDPTRL